MSGICGFAVRKDSFVNEENTLAELKKMTSTMIHRGPNGEGYWINMQDRLAIGYRHLHLIGASISGSQPLVAESGHYILALDGAITNYSELRKELEDQGVQFRCETQAEVLVHLIERYGIINALRKITGSLGLVVYNREKRTLQLARDRFGLKTVYYGWNNGAFFFASELKAIKSLSFFEPEIDHDSIYQYLKYQYIKSPWSIYQGVGKLLPAEIVTINLDNGESSSEIYYSFEDTVLSAEKAPFTGSLDECVEELDSLLTRVVSREIQTNVPVGTFLSSGLDSSTISAIAQKVLNGKLKTYCIGCYSEKLNDAEMAKEYANVLGTQHHEIYVDEKEYVELLPHLSEVFDEPFAQPSAIPYYYISKLAGEDVGVCLGGDGGDELFGFIPLIQHVFAYLNNFPFDGINYDNFTDLYDYLQYSLFKTQGFRDNMFAYTVPDHRHYRQFAPKKINDYYLSAMCYDLSIFNESETMIKVDRASMANSLQVREPLLDLSVIEYAFRLPNEFRYDKGVFRVAQRKLLARYIPEQLIERKKRAFHIPVNRYILSDSCKDIREWAFSEKALKQSGFFCVEETMAMLHEQLTEYGKLPVQSFTNNVLMLQLWLRANGYID